LITDEIRRKLSESKKGEKNPQFVPSLSVDLSSEEKKKTFSYLVGYWAGDGLKTHPCLGFSVRNEEIYISSLLKKVSLILNKEVSYRYSVKSYCLFFHQQTKEIKEKITKELLEKKIVSLFPWEFICGFLDSDGWVSFCDSKSKNINIAVSNTNMAYLLLLGYALKTVFIPYNLNLGVDYKKGYKYNWVLKITTSAALYVAANKLLPITIDNLKKVKFNAFIDHYHELHDKQTIPICETFPGFQGEGRNTGALQYFIRASSCDMKCVICDSKYSWGKGKSKSLKELLQECLASGYKNICLTGGEIAQFEDKLNAFIGMLRANDFHITLQTNGLHYSRAFALVHTVAMDIKTPCTGEKSNENLILLLDPEKDEIKTLIYDINDYEYSIKINSLAKKLGIVQVLQPCNSVGKDSVITLIEKYKWLCDLVLKDRRWANNIKVLPQLHVLIWGNERAR
jgi:7-carboxy-7-deazaguanine synthase